MHSLLKRADVIKLKFFLQCVFLDGRVSLKILMALSANTSRGAHPTDSKPEAVTFLGAPILFKTFLGAHTHTDNSFWLLKRKEIGRPWETYRKL